MTGGVNGGGGAAHSLEQLMCVTAAPSLYIKEGEEEAGHQGRAKERGVLLGLQS